MNYKKWSDKNVGDLWGRLVAVTGTTGGIGQELCLHLAALGASLVLLDRNAQKAAELEKRLLTQNPNIKIYRITVDLESIESVKAAVVKLKELPIDVFVHNAGAYSIPRRVCTTGYDNVFQINFVSPYYMIRQLLPHLKSRPDAAVVVVGSIAHNYSKIDPDDIDFSKRTRASLVYGNAKRYLMFSNLELFKDIKGVRLSVVHPGITFTNITAHYPKPIFAIIKHPMKIIFMKPKKASLSILKGISHSPKYCQWIGPKIFDVWGLPKTKELHTGDSDERKKIAQIAEKIYKQLIIDQKS